MRSTIHFDSVIASVKHAKILPCLHELLSKKIFFFSCIYGFVKIKKIVFLDLFKKQ